MSSAETTAPHEEVETEPRRRGLRTVLLSLGVLGLVLALVVGGASWFAMNRYAGNIDRVSGAAGR